MAQITYDDKVALNENSSVAEINKVTDDNMNEIKDTINTNTPVGSISLFAGATAPNGWLICDGSAVSRTDYAGLFSVIGTTYGTGDGSTTFNIPNLKGKIPVGLDTNDTSFDTIGETGGSKTDNLSNAYAKVGRSSAGYSQLAYKTKAPTGTDYFNREVGNNGGINGDSWIITEVTELGGTTSTLQPYIVMNYIISY